MNTVNATPQTDDSVITLGAASVETKGEQGLGEPFTPGAPMAAGISED